MKKNTNMKLYSLCLALFIQVVDAVPAHNQKLINPSPNLNAETSIVSKATLLMDVPKAKGKLDQQSAKELRQVVEKKLLQLAGAQATDPSEYVSTNQDSWQAERAEYEQRLQTIRANCEACEGKELLLNAAYETASLAHQTVTNQAAQITAVTAATLAYEQAMGATSSDDGFNAALQNLKNVINPFDSLVTSHAQTDADLVLPSGLTELVASVNTKAGVASERHEDVNTAKQNSINSGLCQPSDGGANEECTTSHENRSKLAAIDADTAVNTAKGARDTACSEARMNDATTDAATNCTCSNGDPAANSLCTMHNAEKCASCDGNYHLSNDQCVANTCTCSNGQHAANSLCTVHNAEKCASCDGNYHLSGDQQCVENGLSWQTLPQSGWMQATSPHTTCNQECGALGTTCNAIEMAKVHTEARLIEVMALVNGVTECQFQGERTYPGLPTTYIPDGHTTGFCAWMAPGTIPDCGATHGAESGSMAHYAICYCNVV